MVKIQYEVKVSIMDAEPMDALVTMLYSWDRHKLPPEYKDQLEGWAAKYLNDTEGRDETAPLIQSESK